METFYINGGTGRTHKNTLLLFLIEQYKNGYYMMFVRIKIYYTYTYIGHARLIYYIYIIYRCDAVFKKHDDEN